ncbi:MAG: hypothetical protein KA275_04235, partial [Chitinophagaceae bacterium]|nr:hypothetical protein [Chitinophagaceae bacterium]
LNIYYTNSSSFGIAQFNTFGARFSTKIINNLNFSLGFEHQKNLQDLKFTDIENTSNDYLVHSYIDNYHLTTNNFDFLLNYKLLELKLKNKKSHIDFNLLGGLSILNFNIKYNSYMFIQNFEIIDRIEKNEKSNITLPKISLQSSYHFNKHFYLSYELYYRYLNKNTTFTLTNSNIISISNSGKTTQFHSENILGHRGFNLGFGLTF